MIISTLPIEHKIRHKEAVFTIHKHGNRIITGGLNGEMKIWTDNSEYITIIKKHTGSVSTVRFSPDGKLIASAGDDGYVYIFKTVDYSQVHSVKHNSDVTNIEWLDSNIISVDLDGVMIITDCDTWSTVKRFNDHSSPITGLCVSPDGHWICTYSEGTLLLYKDLALVKTSETERGLIMESLNSRLSFSPNSKFISVGLQFNKKYSSVDIFDNKLERTFSLIGHVAPSEITSFCPLSFKAVKGGKKGPLDSLCLREDKGTDSTTETHKGEKHYVIAVASQDLSVSFWSTSNPKPFLLIKNFTDSPVLDFCWDGTVLYASSYDGTVKRITFEKDELGEITQENNEEDELELQLSIKNMELTKSRAKRVKTAEKEVPNKERLREMELPACDFKVNSERLEVFIGNKDEAAMKEQSMNCKNPVLFESSDKLRDTDQLPISVEDLKPKRIKPVMLQRSAPLAVTHTENGSGVVLFDINLPEKLRMAKTEPFKCQLGIYSLVLNENSTRMSVLRDGKVFYSITGIINKVAYSEKYLVLYTTHIQIYSLSSGRLVLPYISCRLAFMSILNDSLLFVSCYGDFTVLNLVKLKSSLGKLPKTKGLTSVGLHDRFYVVAKYDSEILYYHRRLKCWFSLNPEFNSIYTNSTDYYDDTDETLAFIECQYRNYVLIKDQKGIMSVIRRLVGLVKRAGHLVDSVEYKLEEALSNCKNKEFIREILEELNEESFMWRFVERESEKHGV